MINLMDIMLKLILHWTIEKAICLSNAIYLGPSTLTALLRSIIYNIYVYIITKVINVVLNDGLSI